MPLDDAEPLADRRIPAGDDFLPREAVAALTPEELTRRIRDLAPMIAAHAAEAERLRRPVDEVWSALRASGFFYQFVPRVFGGMETDFDSFIDAGLEVSRACASTGWVATFCAEHNWIVSFFPLETQKKLWLGDHPYIIAPCCSAPPGLATPVDGGWRVSGRWKWGTGVMHADWVMLNAIVPAKEGPPTVLMILAPAAQARVIDTWHMDGMAGTGSNDIVLEDVFIPEGFAVASLARGGRPPAQRDHENPIYGVPLLPFLAMSASIPALGALQSMLHSHRERLSGHVRLGSANAQGEKASAQIRLARADLAARNAELLIRDAGHRMLKVPEMVEPQQTQARLAIRAQVAYAVAMIRDAAVLLAEGAGSGVHSLDQAFQRNLRDILVVASHVAFDVDAAYELHGRGLVGLPPNSLLN